MTDERKALLEELRKEESKERLVDRLPKNYCLNKFDGLPLIDLTKIELVGVIHVLSASHPFLITAPEKEQPDE